MANRNRNRKAPSRTSKRRRLFVIQCILCAVLFMTATAIYQYRLPGADTLEKVLTASLCMENISTAVTAFFQK